jgi:hypothetical protein
VIEANGHSTSLRPHHRPVHPRQGVPRARADFGRPVSASAKGAADGRVSHSHECESTVPGRGDCRRSSTAGSQLGAGRDARKSREGKLETPWPTFWRASVKRGVRRGPSEETAVQRGPDESPYAAAVRALLEDGPMQGKTVEVEAVEGRPPKTIDVPDEKGGTWRYCLAQWTQEGMTAAYTFLYAV